MFAFLSGSPDYGAGQLDTRRYGEQYASRGEDADLTGGGREHSFKTPRQEHGKDTTRLIQREYSSG